MAMRETGTSRRLFKQAQHYLPGGVDSPVRAFKAVGGHPLFIESGGGAVVWDADGNEYIDYVGSWGPLVLGHAPRRVIDKVIIAATSGTSFGAPTQLEVKLAKLVCEAVPSIEMVRFVNSGTEATMSALRLARAFTSRYRIIKFEGCYHGHSDGLLVKGGSGMATLGIPDSPGVTPDVAQNTLVAPYNDLQAVELLFNKYPGEIAAVIVEPVAANMGVVLPAKGFLEGLRSLSGKAGALLIFDEVITGFRLAYGGAQAVLGVKPDLTCLGKIIGGGLPVGAYGGRSDIMEMVAPSGPVYQAGTLSGNPLAMTAGIATLQALKSGSIYARLEEAAAELQEGIEGNIKEAGVSASISRCASMLTLFFTSGPITDYQSAKKSDTVMFARFFHSLLESGIYWPPAKLEAAFISAAHNRTHIRSTIKAVREALLSLKAADVI
jgi:glutamate-1-semialdehyde 2,1-aminomutase